MLSRMADGEVKDIISRDPLIMQFGAIQHDKLGKRRFSNISQRLRAIASFLQASKHSNMMEFIAPENIDEAIRCGKLMGGLDGAKKNSHTELPEYARPSKAMRLGGELRQLALLKKGMAL